MCRYVLPSRDSADHEDEEKKFNGDCSEGQTNETQRPAEEVQTRTRPRAILTPPRLELQNRECMQHTRTHTRARARTHTHIHNNLTAYYSCVTVHHEFLILTRPTLRRGWVDRLVQYTPLSSAVDDERIERNHRPARAHLRIIHRRASWLSASVRPST